MGLSGSSALIAPMVLCVGTWKQRWLALHLYAENTAAMQLYQQAGFQELDRIAPLLLGPTRILMAKPVRQ
jgi:ribosomal protein S18 acetylase RimI-like enzyme